MHVIIGIHMSAPIIIQEAAIFRNKGSFKQTEKAGGEPMKRNNLVAVALISDITESEEDTTSLKFKAKGDFLHGVSAIPMKPRLQVGKTTNYEKVQTISRCALFLSSAREEKPHVENYTTKWTKMVEVRTLGRLSNSEGVQS